MLLYKQKKNQVAKGKRFLISVTVLGSAGPIRFVVNEEELVAAVIDTALKSYAREGRLPILGSDLNDFLLYCRNAASDAISPCETIGSLEARNFMLCKKPQHLKEADDGRSTAAFSQKGGSGSWKAWINKGRKDRQYYNTYGRRASPYRFLRQIAVAREMLTLGH
ncbi:hypothetical protein OIU76_013864 [Salix suchowensis]|uniref:DUF7054 domain-containing protein n=1 Tax=Salix suchowensis TaxID=1278906 RepID=A0ABQ9A3L0_9ROSI|nr:hypothetical protein OIU76_013864 [Salix suchowensis]KAJ6321941.1 hypothetical protein OIU77_011930 [Salix suchowensis]KAJ6351033.1 hypothetical protein OIU78_007040 [Salix suchowensis]